MKDWRRNKTFKARRNSKTGKRTVQQPTKEGVKTWAWKRKQRQRQNRK
jgi:hypothetical protein